MSEIVRETGVRVDLKRSGIPRTGEAVLTVTHDIVDKFGLEDFRQIISLAKIAHDLGDLKSEDSSVMGPRSAPLEVNPSLIRSS